MPLSFEQQPNESAKAFSAFSVYLGLGAERSLAAVGTQLGKSEPLMKRWSAKYDWLARVQAHAAHLADVERQAAEALATLNGVDWAKRQDEHREEEWQVRCELLELGRETIRRWKEHEQKCGTLEGVSRLFELASKLGRLASGMPSEVKEVNTTLTATVDVEWEISLRKAYGPKQNPESLKAEILTGDSVDVQAVPVLKAKP